MTATIDHLESEARKPNVDRQARKAEAVAWATAVIADNEIRISQTENPRLVAIMGQVQELVQIGLDYDKTQTGTISAPTETIAPVIPLDEHRKQSK